MILGFKKQFVPKILSGEKIHTIREDVQDRWKPENKIHFATGIRTKDYHQFKEGMCLSVQSIEITYQSYNNRSKAMLVKIDGRLLSITEMRELVRLDGFDSFHEFSEWFNEDFKGKIIHWTIKTY